MKTYVATILLTLLLAACGNDPAPEIPSWAHVAPEQIAEAAKHGVPVAFENDLGMRFVLIPAGTFLMGSPVDEEGRVPYSDETQHEVTISQPFYMSICEATNGQFVMFKPEHDAGTGHDGAQQPTCQTSWESAAAFASWLTTRDRSREYDLPTEAQWEYACRAGTTTPYSTGPLITPSDARYDVFLSAPVGSYPHNAWGLHDMHGNVWEWCLDWCGPYPTSKVVDPRGPDTPIERVLRGGSWTTSNDWVRSAHRYMSEPTKMFMDIGFRLVSPLPEPGE